MHAAGIILIALGAAMSFASMMGIAFSNRDKNAKEISALELVDWLFLNRTIQFCRDLFGGIVLGIKDKSSPCRPVVILLFFSICLLAAGLVLV